MEFLTSPSVSPLLLPTESEPNLMGIARKKLIFTLMFLRLNVLLLKTLIIIFDIKMGGGWLSCHVHTLTCQHQLAHVLCHQYHCVLLGIISEIEIHITIWTNTLCSLNKYILQFGQIHFVGCYVHALTCHHQLASVVPNLPSLSFTGDHIKGHDTFYNFDKYMQFGQILLPIWTNTNTMKVEYSPDIECL